MVMKQSCLSFVSKPSTEEASPHTSSKRPTEKKKAAPVAKKRKTDSSHSGSLPTASDLYGEFVRSLESHAGEQWATRPLAAVENRALQQKPLSLSEQATPIRMALSSASSVIIRQKKVVGRLNEKIVDLQEKLRKAKHKAMMSSSTTAAAAMAEVSPTSTAGSLTADLSPVVILDSVACVRPWGKFEIRIGTSTLELRSRSPSGPQSLVVSLSSITNLIAVKMPTTKEHIVVLPLCDGLQVGKTLQRVLVLKFKTTDPPISSACVKAGTSRFSAAQLRGLCQTEAAGGGSVAAHAMASLLQALTGKNIETTDLAIFRSSAGKDCLTCHYKANHGAVFFFKSGILFALKPIIFIPKDEIRQIEFGSQTRYFELIVQTEKHERFGFEMIEIDEHPAVSQFLREQKFLSTKQEGPDDDSDTDEESQQQEQAEPRQNALKKKQNSSSIHDLDEDLDDDSDDADFSPEEEEEEDEGYRTDDDLGDATGSEEEDDDEDEDDSAFQAVSGTIDDDDDDDDDDDEEEDNDCTRDKLHVINVVEEEEEQEDTEQMEGDDDNESTD